MQRGVVETDWSRPAFHQPCRYIGSSATQFDGIQASAEYKALPQPTGTPDQLVAADYLRFLDRAPDPFAASWQRKLAQGESNDAVIAMILSDLGQEFYNKTSS